MHEHPPGTHIDVGPAKIQLVAHSIVPERKSKPSSLHSSAMLSARTCSAVGTLEASLFHRSVQFKALQLVRNQRRVIPARQPVKASGPTLRSSPSSSSCSKTQQLFHQTGVKRLISLAVPASDLAASRLGPMASHLRIRLSPASSSVSDRSKSSPGVNNQVSGAG